MIEESGCADNTGGEEGSRSSGRVVNEGFPLMCVLKNPSAGTRPFLWALDLERQLGGKRADKSRKRTPS